MMEEARREAESAGTKPAIDVPETITVRDLAKILEVGPIAIIKELMRSGIMANINQSIDRETATIVAEDMGFKVKEEPVIEKEEEELTLVKVPPRPFLADEKAEDLVPRPPVVTVMGHVDHGKTTLLDAIREARVAAQEAGGMTQQIGAYQVGKNGRKITFLDTPGHEAFTAMRARGAQATDIAVLVVAADDGVMPQTVEAINHARAAHVPIIVALNKMDKPNINPELVKQQLADLGLTVEDWGGNVICVPVSAKKRTGLDDLLGMILLVADLSELKANPNRPAVGIVIEGRLDKNRGPMATLLVQNGTLRIGDYVLIGDTFGRVRAMFNELGDKIEEAAPSTPVAVLGLSGVPTAGSKFEVVSDERAARLLASSRADEKRQAGLQPTQALSLDEIYQRFQAGEVKELNLILKADTQGSLEAVSDSLMKLGDEELKVDILHKDSGSITESDIMLAIASKAIVIGFGVGATPSARVMAESNAVDVRYYDVIYELLEDVERALKGLLEPELEEVVIGHGEVRAIFDIPNRGKVAGMYVSDGKVTRNALARIARGGEMICDGQVSSLKRFAEDVREVNSGYECGLGLEGFENFEKGDILEFYIKKILS